MKRLLLFIFPILIIISLGFGLFGTVQVRLEEEKLLDDLQRKARAVAEAMDLSVQHILSTNNLRNANYLVEKFQNRERLQGCVIYTKDGEIFSITERFSDWKDKEKPYIKEVINDKEPRSSLESFKDYSLHSYTFPIVNDAGTSLGAVEIIHDTSYVFLRLSEIWRSISVTLIGCVILIFLISLFLQKRIFILPIQQLTLWFKHFQKGEIDDNHPIKDKDVFGELASEVEQVALSLRVARQSVSRQAQVRIEKEDIWTETKLRDLIHAKLGDNSFFVVSNREPFMHVIDEVTGKAKCLRPASGVVTAIDPILRSCGGTWIAHGSGNADRKFVNSKNKLGVPPEDPRYILKRIWLTKEEEEGYYYGFSNEGLWPLCHITHTRPIFREKDWNIYQKVNEKFVETILEEFPAKDPFVFIQDYHFTTLPKMIKAKRPQAKVALFWHIPWPNPEVFSICPYQKEILEGMLSCDLIGFHVQFHCNNFLDTANRFLEARVDTEKFSVVRGNQETLIRAFPISVNPQIYENYDGVAANVLEGLRYEYDLKDKIVALGVDRIDYTKGLVERIMAIDRFLQKYPQYRSKFVFIQLGAPSRTHIKRYHDLMGEIDELVEKVNWKYSEENSKPIIYLKRHFSADEIIPFFLLADICMVSSLHDGMNLVAKEYIATKKDLTGALMLSCFTGASRELTDAIQINPYSTEEFAEAIKTTIEMPVEEKQRRMANMRKTIHEHNIYRWAANIINELTALRKD